MDVIVRFEPSGREVTVPTGTSLLEAARRASLPIASACGADGACARCGMRILDGASELSGESDREAVVKSRNRIEPELRLACRVRVQTSVTATTPYW